MRPDGKVLEVPMIARHENPVTVGIEMLAQHAECRLEARKEIEGGLGRPSMSTKIGEKELEEREVVRAGECCEVASCRLELDRILIEAQRAQGLSRQIVKHGASLAEVVEVAKGRTRGERRERAHGRALRSPVAREVLKHRRAKRVREGHPLAGLPETAEERAVVHERSKPSAGSRGLVGSHEGGRIDAGEERGLTRRALGESGDTERGIERRAHPPLGQSEESCVLNTPGVESEQRKPAFREWILRAFGTNPDAIDEEEEETHLTARGSAGNAL
jgi:hypothetical protein